MNEFYIFFTTGVQHITDFNGLDHILFIAALCLRYLYHDWKQLLVLITAFTIGHSLTLALSTFNFILLPVRWTEFFIAVTIFITAFSNVFARPLQQQRRYPTIYFFALFFGLVHGLGFSSLLRSMLGKDQRIVVQLLAFNLGLEVGQLVIVALLLAVSYIFVSRLAISRRGYILFISGAIAALSAEMMVQRFLLLKL